MPISRPGPVSRTEVLDLTAVADRCHVSKFTPQQWRQREVLPPVDFPEITTPLWRVATIREWAHRTNREFEDRLGDVLTPGSAPAPAVSLKPERVGAPPLAFSTTD